MEMLVGTVGRCSWVLCISFCITCFGTWVDGQLFEPSRYPQRGVVLPLSVEGALHPVTISSFNNTEERAGERRFNV